MSNKEIIYRQHYDMNYVSSHHQFFHQRYLTFQFSHGVKFQHMDLDFQLHYYNLPAALYLLSAKMNAAALLFC